MKAGALVCAEGSRFLSRVAVVAAAVWALLGSVPAEAARPNDAFSGRLEDARTGAPVAGAEVTIVGQTGSARSDANGRFTWTGDVRPPFVVLVVMRDGRVARPVQVERLDATAVLTILVEAAVAEDVTVAAGVAPSIDTSPGAALTLLSARELALRTPANLMQAIESVPGVSQVSEGQAAVPAVRGLARGRTLVLIDGSRVVSERRVGPSATFLDPAVVGGVDVSRGPGSVAYGSDAFGGVISVRTRRPDYNATEVTGSVTVGAGIPDRRLEATVAAGFGTGGLIVSAHAREAGDYEAPGGEVFNSGWSDRGVLARVERVVKGGLFAASWQGDFGRDIERPRNNSRAIRFYTPFEDSHRLNASYERGDAGPFELVRVSGFFGTFSQRTDQDRFPTATRAREIERSEISARDYQLRVIGEKAFGRRHIELGLDLSGRFGLEAHDIFEQFDFAGDVQSTRDNLSIDTARRVDTGLFLQGTSTVGTHGSATAGVRVDVVRNVNRGGHFGDRSVSNAAAAGFGAVSAGPFANVTLTAQLSRGFRDPTLSDRFYRGPTGRGFITGNPDLVPETSLQLDLGARYATARVRAAAYYYHYRIADLVERYQTETDFFFFRNQGVARLRGAEFELQAVLGQGWTVEAAAQRSRGVLPGSGVALDDISPDTVSFGVRKAWPDRATAYGRLSFFADDDRPGPSEVAAPGHTGVELGASWQVGSRVEVRGGVKNLLDQAYYASPDPRFVQAPGVNGFVTLAIKY